MPWKFRAQLPSQFISNDTSNANDAFSSTAVYLRKQPSQPQPIIITEPHSPTSRPVTFCSIQCSSVNSSVVHGKAATPANSTIGSKWIEWGNLKEHYDNRQKERQMALSMPNADAQILPVWARVFSEGSLANSRSHSPLIFRGSEH